MKSGCAICHGNFHVSRDNCLATLRPDIAAQWHPTLNRIKATDVRCNSMKRIVWVCTTNENHTWTATVAERHRGQGCPYCNGNNTESLDPSRSLAVAFPDIAAQWHPTRNGDLTPAQVFKASNTVAVWICKRDASHVWSAAIKARTSSHSDCPTCNVNKCETRLRSILDHHSHVAAYTPECALHAYCTYDKRDITLFCDAKVDLVNGAKCVIEIDGPQHFEIVRNFHRRGYMDLLGQFKRDLAKNAAVWKSGASLLRIKHHKYVNMEKIVDEFLGECMNGTQILRTSDAEWYNAHQIKVRKALEG
jgi:hypothetical protein